MNEASLPVSMNGAIWIPLSWTVTSEKLHIGRLISLNRRSVVSRRLVFLEVRADLLRTFVGHVTDRSDDSTVVVPKDCLDSCCASG